MITHRDADDIVSTLTENRGLLARIWLALRAAFSITQPEQGNWADGARGL
jgi:hypothetical protein